MNPGVPAGIFLYPKFWSGIVIVLLAESTSNEMGKYQNEQFSLLTKRHSTYKKRNYFPVC